jgi:DNA invertase Pin-like site-specific DNA recombinase
MSKTTPDNAALSAVAYLRISEDADRRGQDPERQLVVIRPWCAREGVELLDIIRDEGTSASKTNPFERDRFIEACQRAVALGATAIVVEVGDRFGRRGSMESAWAEHEMKLRYGGLLLWRADKSIAQHGTMAARVTDTIHDEGARDWVEKHKVKVASGMANAKAKGVHVGRPAKLSAAERALATKLRADGTGWRTVALEVSRRRGAFDVADPKVSKRLRVSHMLIRRVVTGDSV